MVQQDDESLMERIPGFLTERLNVFPRPAKHRDQITASELIAILTDEFFKTSNFHWYFKSLADCYKFFPKKQRRITTDNGFYKKLMKRASTKKNGHS